LGGHIDAHCTATSIGSEYIKNNDGKLIYTMDKDYGVIVRTYVYANKELPKETKEQITKAAEQEASKKLTPEISKSVSQGIAKVKNMVSKGANITTKAMNTTIGGVATTLVGFYVVGQTYQDAVESYKKSQLSPFQIYEKLLSQKKISLSWNDLKWVFGSDGSVSDNQKLGTALLSGYNGENSNEWLDAAVGGKDKINKKKQLLCLK
jgi:hypothetical protein